MLEMARTQCHPARAFRSTIADVVDRCRNEQESNAIHLIIFFSAVVCSYKKLSDVRHETFSTTIFKFTTLSTALIDNDFQSVNSCKNLKN